MVANRSLRLLSSQREDPRIENLNRLLRDIGVLRSESSADPSYGFGKGGGKPPAPSAKSSTSTKPPAKPPADK